MLRVDSSASLLDTPTSEKSWLSFSGSRSPSPSLYGSPSPSPLLLDSPLPWQNFFDAHEEFDEPPQSNSSNRRFFYAQPKRRLHPLALILPAFLGGALIAYLLTRASTNSVDPIQSSFSARNEYADPSELSRLPSRTFGRGSGQDWHEEQKRRIRIENEDLLDEYRRRCVKSARVRADHSSETVFEDIEADHDVHDALTVEANDVDCRALEQLLRNAGKLAASNNEPTDGQSDKTGRSARARRKRPTATEDEHSVDDILAWYGYGETPAPETPESSTATSHAPVHVLKFAPSEPGDYITTLFEQGGEGTRVYLQPRTVWDLETPILLTHDNQELATLDYPEDDEEKALLRTIGKSANAVNLGGLKNARLRNLVIDGLEPRFGRTEPATALVFLAGPEAEDQVVEDCVLRHPRGWSACHIYEHGLRTRIVNNKIGPAGKPPPRGPLVNVKGPWADCISNAGIASFIAGNELTDCTDGGIVLFGAMYSQVVNNTITARDRDLLGGINLVDSMPYDGNYTGVRVAHNRIISDGAYIRLGIGIGSRPWEDSTGVGSFGATVEHNGFGPGAFGYAIAVGGAADTTVLDNRILARTIFEGQAPLQNPAAQPFVKFVTPEEPGGRLQDGFTQGYFRNLISIQPGRASSARHYASTFSLRPGHPIHLRSARLELQNHGVLVMREEGGDKRVLWSSKNLLNSTDYPVAKLTPEGVLEIRDASGQLLWASTTSPLPKAFPGQQDRTASVVISDTAPHISVVSGAGDIVWKSPMSHYSAGWQLFSGQYISLSETSPAWLTLDPKTSQLVLHTSQEPLEIQKSSIVWHSPSHMLVPWDGIDAHRSVARLQEDSNLVINGWVADEFFPLWATDTDDEEELPYIALHGPGDPGGGMRLELLSRDLRPRWSSIHDHDHVTTRGTHSTSIEFAEKLYTGFEYMQMKDADQIDNKYQSKKHCHRNIGPDVSRK